MKQLKRIFVVLLMVFTICIMNINAFAENNSTISFNFSVIMCADEFYEIALPKGNNNNNVVINCNVNNISDEQYWIISIHDYSDRIVSSVKIIDAGIYFIDYSDDTNYAWGTQYYLTISTNCQGGSIYGYLQL